MIKNVVQPGPAMGQSQGGTLFIYYLQGVVRDKDLSDCTFFLGNWVEENLSFLFFSRPARLEVSKLLQRQPELILMDEFEMSYEDWQGGKVDSFCLGKLSFVPFWEAATSRERSVRTDLSQDLQTIVFDPGVVFGAGNHQTTISCLEAIHYLLSYAPCPKTVLDLGCGSGLLSLAAARLGSKEILAVDLNPLAVKTCKKNIELNGLEANVLAVQGRAEEFVLAKADLIVANIHYDILSRIIADSAFTKAKWAILSGLLRSQMGWVQTRLASMPVQLLNVWDDGVWFTCLCKMTCH